MQKSDIVIGQAQDYSSDGWGVVKIAGFPLFVKDLIKGESAEILIIKMEKNYGYGKIIKLLNEGKKRVVPICPVAGRCGGCQFQHIQYSEQLNIKRESLAKTLKKITNKDYQVEPVEASEPPLPYRNKAQLPVATAGDGSMQCGYYRYNSHEIIDIEACYLQSDNCNKVYRKVKEYLVKYQLYRDIRHILLRESESNGEMMVVLITQTRSLKGLDLFVNQLTKKCPQVVSIQLNLNQSTDNVILGDELELVYGKKYLSDELLGLTFQISAKAFYQVNVSQCEKLYQKALALAAITTTDTVLDLYCGSGTITLLAARLAKKAIGIEIVPEAVEDARLNALINECDNVDFYCGDAGVVAGELKEKIDVVFVDPPRKGLSDTAKTIITKILPERLIYISCNPATLARDLNDLQAYYETTVIYPFDMFPYTKHVECLVKLDKKTAG